MRKYVILILSMFIGIVQLQAQNESGTKILVFRNNGEINSFNTSDISKIELSYFDNDSTEHEDFVSQVFHKCDDSFIMIPIAEIDSVAFGDRNIIEPLNGVRKLSDEEAAAISFFNPSQIEYNTPLSLQADEVVYYDRMTDILPYGLCCRIKNVANKADSFYADIEYLDPAEVFERYLITGNTPSSATRSDDDSENKPFEIEIPEVTIDGFKMKGSLKLATGLDMDDAVADFKNHYYHAGIKLYVRPELTFSFQTEESLEKNIYGEKPLTISFPFLGGAIRANINLNWFVDLKAELGIEYEFTTESYISIDWTRKDGDNTFGPVKTNQVPFDALQQKIEAHLNGELMIGPAIDVELATLFNLAGVGAEFKIGPKLESEFSLGAINQLEEEYDQDVYAKGEIRFSAGVKAETYSYHHDLEWNKLITKLPFETDIFFPIDTLRLIPEFHTKAILAKETKQFVQSPGNKDAVSISSFTETSLPMPLDIDYIVEGIGDKSTIAETEKPNRIEENSTDSQNLNMEINLPSDISKESLDNLVVYPIVNYKGYRIKAKPADVASDMVFSPMIASIGGRSSYFVSGMTPVSHKKVESDTYYIEGNLLGLPAGDDRFKKKNTFTLIDFIDLEELNNTTSTTTHPLIGTWSGVIDDSEIVISFIDPYTGRYNGKNFTYSFNSPLKGGIAIVIEDGSTINFSVLEISDERLRIVSKGNDVEYSLTRQI